MAKRTFEDVIKTATQTEKSWKLTEVVQFHYFNPNGLYAKKRATDQRISAAVEEGLCKSGAIIAYGTFNSRNSDRLGTLVSRKQLQRIPVQVTLDMLADDIAKAEKFLAEIGA